jgi:peroxiredoxin
MSRVINKIIRLDSKKFPLKRTISFINFEHVKRDGERIPSVTFKVRVRNLDTKSDNPFVWKDVTSDTLFSGKRNVVFAVPGAFVSNCSVTDQHLPNYHKLYRE